MLISHFSTSKTNKLLVGALTISLIAVSAKVALSQSRGPIKSIDQPKSAVASSHIPQSTTGLDKKLTLLTKRQPLSKLMHDVQKATTGVQLSQADSVKDVSVYCVLNAQTPRSLLPQIQRLFTDSEWQYQWQERTSDSTHSAYRLWRQPVDLRAKQEFAKQQASRRLLQLLEDLHGGSNAGEDPETAWLLSQPMFHSGIAMLGTLSEGQIDGVLNGQPLTLPFPSLSPEQQALSSQAMGGYELATSTAPNGAVTIDYNKQDLNETGYIVIKAIPEDTDPGSLTLQLCGYSNPDSGLGMGGDVLHAPVGTNFGSSNPNPADANPGPAAPADATPAATADIPSVKVVTIDAALKTQPDQSPLEAYLGAFAAQTHLSILGLWPDNPKDLQQRLPKEPQQRLPQSIIQQPVKDVLDTLARTYHARYIIKDQMVLFRIGFPKTAAAAPALTTSTAAPSPIPSK